MAADLHDLRMLAVLDARRKGQPRWTIARAYGFRTVPNLDSAVRKVIEADIAREPEARTYWSTAWPEITSTLA